MILDPGLFTLKTAEDLFRKLERDFNLMRARPLDPDVCFNFFVTAEHLPEWHFGGDAKKAAAHRDSKALLRVCSHLANGAKHFQVNRHSSVGSTNYATVVRYSPVGEPPKPQPSGTETRFSVQFTQQEFAELGHEMTVDMLGAKLLEYWRQELGLRS